MKLLKPFRYLQNKPSSLRNFLCCSQGGREVPILPIENEENLFRKVHDFLDIDYIKTSASSRLKKGVADFGGCWETSGHKEVFHEQEICCASVG
jgi:hypothetical protein